MGIKKKIKQLLGYCPKPSPPLTTTLKRYALPTAIIITVSAVLSTFFLASQSTILPPLPITSIEYNPGVSIGDYVVYGNFVCNREHPEGVVCIADLSFKKMEVIAVSGKEVTFLHSEKFKNGTATWNDGRTEVWDVEKAMWSDETPDYVDSTLIIAANLTQGDCIQSDPAPPDFHIVESGVRTYLGVSRNVSILRMHTSVDNNGEPFEVTYNLVYDEESGIRLEGAFVTLAGEVLSSMSIVETNIFLAPTSSPEASMQENNKASIPPAALYVAAGVIAVVVLLAAVIIFMNRKLRGGEKDTEE